MLKKWHVVVVAIVCLSALAVCYRMRSPSNVFDRAMDVSAKSSYGWAVTLGNGEQVYMSNAGYFDTRDRKLELLIVRGDKAIYLLINPIVYRRTHKLDQVSVGRIFLSDSDPSVERLCFYKRDGDMLAECWYGSSLYETLGECGIFVVDYAADKVELDSNGLNAQKLFKLVDAAINKIDEKIATEKKQADEKAVKRVLRARERRNKAISGMVEFFN